MHIRTALLTASFFVLLINPAFAYLDPGTGSMLLQGLIGGIAAGITVISLYYHKVKLFVARMMGRQKKDADTSK